MKSNLKTYVDRIQTALHGLPIAERRTILDVSLQRTIQLIHDQEDEFRRAVEREVERQAA